jgi:PKD repeat protein
MAVFSASAEDVSPYVSIKINKEKEVLNKSTMIVTTTVGVKIKNNSGKKIYPLFHAVFDIGDPDITMPNASGGNGLGPYGKYYYDLSSELPKGVLKPNASVKFSAVFVHRRSERLQYRITVFGSFSASANLLPAIDSFAATPSSGDYPLPVAFAATAHDSDGTIVSYAFNFGDGSPVQTGSSSTANHTYTSAGNYTAIVTVTDDRGGTASRTVAVTVTAPNAAPVVDSFTATPSSGDYPLPVAFAATAHDTDGTIVSYAFNFGDGSPVQTGSSSTANHTYTSAGNYTASVTVTDDRGGDASQIASITVTESTPNSTPLISNVAAPSSIVLGAKGTATFDYADAEGDIVSLEVFRQNAYGNNAISIPAANLGIAGTNGAVSIALPTEDLVFGENKFVLSLKDSHDVVSAPAEFTVKLTGVSTGGTSPQIILFEPQSATWTRPSGADDRLKPRFTYDYIDPDADIERMRIRIIRPTSGESITESDAAMRGIAGTGGSVIDQFMTLRNTDGLGTYMIELSLIDRNGNISDPKSTTLDLVADGGMAPPAITGFTPDGGPAGTIVTVTGTGFDAVTPENNRVTITSIPAEISDVTGTGLKLVVPEGAGTDRIVVRNGNGTAFSSSVFAIPTAVLVSPQSASLVLGGSQKFTAAAVSSYETAVTWSVNGLAGGNATVGTISAQGLYQAPEEMPAGGFVTISAALVSNPSILGQTSVALFPPPLTPGQARVLAVIGGVVRSDDRTAAVDIPAGALQASSNISVQVLRGNTRPTDPAGRRVLGSVEFGPSGLTFSAPVAITIPLSRYFVPGTHLELYLWNPGAGSYESQGTATVLDNGEQASAMVSHFSTYSILDPSISCADAPSPVITGMTAGLAMEEGRKVPVKISGSNLGSLLTAKIRHAGAETNDITARTFYGLGSQAGVLLDIQPILDLPAGSTRTYTLRLEVDGCGLYADRDFTVAGLDELLVDGFDTKIVNAPLDPVPIRYSKIDIAGTVRVNSGTFDIESTGPVKISGAINASGNWLSPDAHGQVCGGIDSNASNPDELCGRRQGSDTSLGGLGREDNGCYWGEDGFDCAETENFGADGKGAISPFGVGGTPGRNVSGATLVSIIQDVVTCASSGAGCSALVQDAVELVGEIADIAEGGPLGKPGTGGSAGTAGGGGGGGGCASLAGCSILGVTMGFPGGGGGVGGLRGYNINILSSDSIDLNGTIEAEGGHGGNGSASSASILGIELLSGFSGAGGGGGGGGRVRVESAGEIYAGPSGKVSAAGGQGGEGGGTALADGRFVLFRAARGRDGRPGRMTLSDSSSGYVFDPTSIDNMVTNRSILSVQINAPGIDPVYVRVEEESGQAKIYEANVSGAGTPHGANILLANGFNTICITHPSDNCSGPSAMHPLLQKRIFSAFTDSDGDSISDADEIALGINPNNPDTDGDGLQDGNEIQLGTNPSNADTDGDGLKDGLEVARGRTSPTKWDTDGDGIPDGEDFNVAQITDGLGTKPPGAINYDGNVLAYGSCVDEFNCSYNPVVSYFLWNDITKTQTDTFQYAPPGEIGTPYHLSRPSISGDGTKLVFTGEVDSTVVATQRQVFLYNSAAGAYLEPLVTATPEGNANFGIGEPMISFDGSRVAFWSWWDLTGENPLGQAKIFSLDSGNKSVIQLNPAFEAVDAWNLYENGIDVRPYLNADGAHLAVDPYYPAEVPALIDLDFSVIPPAETSAPIDPSFGDDFGQAQTPSISADNSRVAFWIRNNAYVNPPLGHPALAVLNRNTNTYSLITSGSACQYFSLEDNAYIAYLGDYRDDHHPAISADGKRIAFVDCGDLVTDENPNHVQQLFLYDADTGSFRQITHLQGTQFVFSGGYGDFYGVETIRNPQISGDGSRIIFESNSPSLLSNVNPDFGASMQLFMATIPF